MIELIDRYADSYPQRDENEPAPPSAVRVFLSKSIARAQSSITSYLVMRNEKRLLTEWRLLKREEQMKQDLERYQMEIEEKHTWEAYELRERNFLRMKKDESLAKVLRSKRKTNDISNNVEDLETGLSFYQGVVKSYKRWMSSPAKHYDLKGHTAAVLACKLSKCNNYILSCSADRKMMLWELKSGICLRTFIGHLKRVNDCDIHPSFYITSAASCLMSCSGDTTIRLYGPASEKHVLMLRGHEEAVYRCSFSPDGNRIVSCSEDQTVRTWCYPEGYQLHTYRLHQAPVTTVRWSPTGR